jgi:hypothetical protein
VVNLVDMALYLAKAHGRHRAYGLRGFANFEHTTLEAIEQDLNGPGAPASSICRWCSAMHPMPCHRVRTKPITWSTSSTRKKIATLPGGGKVAVLRAADGFRALRAYSALIFFGAAGGANAMVSASGAVQRIRLIQPVAQLFHPAYQDALVADVTHLLEVLGLDRHFGHGRQIVDQPVKSLARLVFPLLQMRFVETVALVINRQRAVVIAKDDRRALRTVSSTSGLMFGVGTNRAAARCVRPLVRQILSH